ncbi:hypothetical protein HK102_005360 [Quaeritorhiza haematococci]|nr:hypothetical protein HK102_005360 [Quaeritorhiza haematococci]
MSYQDVEKWVRQKTASQSPDDESDTYIPPPPPDFEKRIEDYFVSHNPPPFGRAIQDLFVLGNSWDKAAPQIFNPCTSKEEAITNTRGQTYGNSEAGNQHGEATKSTGVSVSGPWTYIAHGSYGAASRPTLDAAIKWQLFMESQPVHFYYKELYPYWVKSLREAASFVGADPEDVVFVSNVEFGMNAVFRSIPFEKDDVLLAFDLTYDAVLYSIEFACSESGAQLVKIPFPWPITSPTTITDSFTRFLEAYQKGSDKPKRIRLAVFQHITSPSAIILPIRELTEVCHQHDIAVMVDGAHSMGQIPLNLRDLGADFYVTNGHKWMCNTRGAGLLYVSSQSWREKIRPLVMSWGYKKGFHSEFIWSGTMDYSPMLSLRIAIRFFDFLGREKVMKRNVDLARWVGTMLVDVWQTKLLVPEEMFGSMTVVQVPRRKQMPAAGGACQTDTCGFSDLHDSLKDQYRIEAPIFTLNGARWIRISCHVYNEEADYIKLARAVLDLYGGDPEQFEMLSRYETSVKAGK